MADKIHFNKSALNCLRCNNVELTHLAESTSDAVFWECPSCHRQYIQENEGPLVYRWLHPISLPLYSILFDKEPLSRAQSIAEIFAESYSKDQLVIMLDEIEHELQHPTQNVRDILNSPASEEECREFLKAFMIHVRSTF